MIICPNLDSANQMIIVSFAHNRRINSPPWPVDGTRPTTSQSAIHLINSINQFGFALILEQANCNSIVSMLIMQAIWLDPSWLFLEILNRYNFRTVIYQQQRRLGCRPSLDRYDLGQKLCVQPLVAAAQMQFARTIWLGLSCESRIGLFQVCSNPNWSSSFIRRPGL